MKLFTELVCIKNLIENLFEVDSNQESLITFRFADNVAQRLEGTDPVSIAQGRPGTANLARARVQDFFQQLRDSVELQEAAALTAVDTHLRHRLCTLQQLQTDLASWLSQVACATLQCEQAIQQDDGRVIMAARDIKEALLSIEKQQQQLSELSPEQLHPEPSIPITFTKVGRVKKLQIAFNLVHPLTIFFQLTRITGYIVEGK